MKPGSPWRQLRRVSFIAAILLATVGVAFHSAVLQSLATLLIVDQQGTRFDYVLPYAGDRVYEIAAEMIARDEAGGALLLEEAGRNVVKFGVGPAEHDVARRELTKHGVSENEIVLVPLSADAESLFFSDLKVWVERNQGVRVCFLGNRFNARRNRRWLDLALGDAHSHQVCVAALTDRRYDETNWWKSRLGVKAFVDGMLRLIHSRLIGLPQRTPKDSWDPIEYEDQLIGGIGNRD
jgi:hypothetical protein